MLRSSSHSSTELKRLQKNKHIKLDNTIVTNNDLLNELKQYVEEQMIQAAHINPQMKLEFTKITIRTKAIEISMRP
jgi:hypothetical protein